MGKFRRGRKAEWGYLILRCVIPVMWYNDK